MFIDVNYENFIAELTIESDSITNYESLKSENFLIQLFDVLAQAYNNRLTDEEREAADLITASVTIDNSNFNDFIRSGDNTLFTKGIDIYCNEGKLYVRILPKCKLNGTYIGFNTPKVLINTDSEYYSKIIHLNTGATLKRIINVTDNEDPQLEDVLKRPDYEWNGSSDFKDQFYLNNKNDNSEALEYKEFTATKETNEYVIEHLAILGRNLVDEGYLYNIDEIKSSISTEKNDFTDSNRVPIIDIISGKKKYTYSNGAIFDYDYLIIKQKLVVPENLTLKEEKVYKDKVFLKFAITNSKFIDEDIYLCSEELEPLLSDKDNSNLTPERR